MKPQTPIVMGSISMEHQQHQQAMAAAAYQQQLQQQQQQQAAWYAWQQQQQHAVQAAAYHQFNPAQESFVAQHQQVMATIAAQQQAALTAQQQQQQQQRQATAAGVMMPPTMPPPLPAACRPFPRTSLVDRRMVRNPLETYRQEKATDDSGWVSAPYQWTRDWWATALPQVATRDELHQTAYGGHTTTYIPVRLCQLRRLDGTYCNEYIDLRASCSLFLRP
jgi:hypothetical protein